eukprot:4638833-Amphidinium_carterae.1
MLGPYCYFATVALTWGAVLGVVDRKAAGGAALGVVERKAAGGVVDRLLVTLGLGAGDGLADRVCIKLCLGPKGQLGTKGTEVKEKWLKDYCKVLGPPKTPQKIEYPRNR